MAVLQLFSYASNQVAGVGVLGGEVILNTLPSPLSIVPLQDFQYDLGVVPFNTESNFQYIPFDEFETYKLETDEGETDADVSDDDVSEIDVLNCQYVSDMNYLDFSACNTYQPVFYTLSDDGWDATVTNVTDAQGYSDMPGLVPFNASGRSVW